MSGPARDLAAGFAPAALAAWRARVRDAIGSPNGAGGADAETALVRRTLDGIARGPLMTRGDLPAAASAFEGRRAGGAADGAAYPWDIRVVVVHPDPARANAAALEELAGGAASLELRIDPTGADGVMIRGLDDVRATLEGVRFELAPIALEAGANGAAAAALLAAHLGSAGLGADAWRGALNLDPVGVLAREGRLAPGFRIDEAADWAAWTAETWPRATTFRADGRIVHEAGGSEAWEIAFTASAGATYLEAMVGRGLGVDDAARQVTLALALDADIHLGIAKLRALRRVWRRIATACGTSADAACAPIHASSSRRMMTRIDPWTNLMRLTAAGFAGAVGGADVLTLAPFTTALGAPTALARRLSRGIQLLLAEESGLSRVGDPAHGSFHHEALTDALARRAWDAIQEIARGGGLERFIEAGELRRVVDITRAERAGAIERGEAVLVGVTDFRADASHDVETDAIDLVRLRAEADARSATRRQPAKDQPGALADLIRLAASGADVMAATTDPSGVDAKGRAVRPIRLSEPFEAPEPAR